MVKAGPRRRAPQDPRVSSSIFCLPTSVNRPLAHGVGREEEEEEEEEKESAAGDDDDDDDGPRKGELEDVR